MNFKLAFVLTQQDAGWALIYALLGLIILAFFSNRRRFAWYRRLTNNHSWLRREYIGETTIFPLYRRRCRDVWIRRWEQRSCYAKTSTSINVPGRYSRWKDDEGAESKPGDQEDAVQLMAA